MANQRKKTKKVISVPMDENLLKEIEREAARRGTNRVSVVNEILAEFLKAAGKLGLIALSILHLTRTPSDWSPSALAGTARAALSIAKSLVARLP